MQSRKGELKMIEPADEILGYSIIQDENSYIEAISKYGEKVDNYDCSNPPKHFPCRAVFIASTYNGIRTLDVFFQFNI